MSEQANGLLPFHKTILRRMAMILQTAGMSRTVSNDIRQVAGFEIGKKIEALGVLFERSIMPEAILLEVLAELKRMRDACDVSVIEVQSSQRYFGELIQKLEAREC